MPHMAAIFRRHSKCFFPSRLKQEQSDTVRPGSVFTKLPDAKGCS